MTAAPDHAEAYDDVFVIDYEMNIPFAGDQETFEYISANDVIDGKVPANYFDGKIVLYGGNAAGLFDMHMTPFSLDRSPTAGVEIQANVINAILEGRHIVRAPLWLLALVTTLSAMAVAAIYLYFDTRLATLSLFVLSGGAVATQMYLFSAYGYWIEVSPLVVALVIAFIFGLMLKMRHVNVALDQEVVGLSEAAALNERAGEKAIIETFRSAEATLRDVLGVPAAALLKVNRDKGLLVPTAQYGLNRINPNQKVNIKLTGDLTSLLISLEPIQVDSLQNHPLAGGRAETSSPGVPRASGAARLERRDGGRDVLVQAARRRVPRRRSRPLASGLRRVRNHLAQRRPLRAAHREVIEPAGDVHIQEPRATHPDAQRVERYAVLAEKSLMGSIMDSIADGVVVTDVLGTIQLLNPKAKEILGLYAESAVGQSAVEFIQRFEDVPFDVMHEKFQMIIERGETFHTDIKLSLPTTRFYTLQLGPVRSKDGRVQGVVAVLSDITELKEMDQMKSDLMSMVTHEIRTPLATVRGFAQFLLKGGIGNEKATEFLEIINRQSNRLVNLVNDFLDVTRIESGRQVVTKGPVDLDKLIQNAVADLKPLADEKTITLQYAQPQVRGPRSVRRPQLGRSGAHQLDLERDQVLAQRRVGKDHGRPAQRSDGGVGTR